MGGVEHVWTAVGRDPLDRVCARCGAMTYPTGKGNGPRGLVTGRGMESKWVLRSPPGSPYDESYEWVTPPETCEETSALMAAMEVHDS